MQGGTGPLIRPASPRRPTRQQIARRRTVAVLLLLLLIVGVWRIWPSSGGETPPGDAAGGPTAPAGGASGGASPSPGTIVPGENPIKHVIFMVKENRTFDHYFGTYPGAEGASVGETLKCTRGRRVHARTRLPAAPGPLHPAARHHARLRERSVRDQRRRDERLQHHRRGRRHERLRTALAQDPARTTGRTPTGSCWRTTSSRRCTARRSPSTSTPSPRSPTASWTTRRTPTPPGSYCDDPLEYTMKFRDRLSKRDVRTIMQPRGAHHRRDPRPAGPHRRLLGGHAHRASTSRSCPTCSRRPASAGSTTACRTSG